MEAWAQASLVVAPSQTPVFSACQAALLLATNCRLFLGAGAPRGVCANVWEDEVVRRAAMSRRGNTVEDRLEIPLKQSAMVLDEDKILFCIKWKDPTKSDRYLSFSNRRHAGELAPA